MLNAADSNRPACRYAVVAHEQKRLDIDIVAVSEVRFAKEGNLKEHGAGYTLYWSGKAETDQCLSCIGFFIRESISSKLSDLPKGH